MTDDDRKALDREVLLWHLREYAGEGGPVTFLSSSREAVGKRVLEAFDGFCTGAWYCLFDDGTILCLQSETLARVKVVHRPDRSGFLNDLVVEEGADRAREHAERAEYERLKAKFEETPRT